MELEDYLREELKRLNRLNDLLEKQMKGTLTNKEPEQIVCNVKAICEIANTIKLLPYLH